MRKSSKKGFTIVELVIVIAVIAILAAVLIPTFTGIVRKARESNDLQLVRNLNTALATDKVLNGEHTTMQDAINAAYEGGYVLAKLDAAAKGNEILWDSANDLFCYFDSDTNEYVYAPEAEKTVAEPKAYQYWEIMDEIPAVDSQKHSIYYTGADVATATVKVGFDAGEAVVATLNYANNGDAQEVIIRTNGGRLVIDAAKDSVEHYGSSDSVLVTAVASASYHVYGVVEKVEIVKGRIVVENNANVYAVIVDEENAPDVSLDVVGEVGVLYAPEDLDVSGDAPEVSTIITDETTGWKLVGTKEELAAALASNATKIALKNDITFDHNYADGLAVFVVDRDVELNLNSYALSVDFVCSSSSAAKNVSLFQLNGGKTFTVSGSGKVEFKQLNNNFGWNAASSVIESNLSKVVVNDSVIIKHLGGTDMAYAIDSRTNGANTTAFVTINGGLIESPYRAIRGFCNSGTNTVTINGGTVRSLKNSAIWMHDPSANNNKGILNIAGGVIESVNSSKPVNVVADTAFDITTNVTGGTFKSNGAVVTGDAIYRK